MKLKIQDNLFLIGDRVISYSTEVGRIIGDSIQVYGKYSRTTTKHLVKLANELGLPLHYKSSERQFFDRYYYGAKVKLDDVMSATASSTIMSIKKKYSCSLIDACIIALGDLRWRDKEKCRRQLEEFGVDSQHVEDTLTLRNLGLLM
jgi:hypothetical protein